MKVLNIISAYSPNGGTIAKLREITTRSQAEHLIYFCCYNENYEPAKKEDYYYQKRDIKTFYGNYGRNIFKHVRFLSKIIKNEGIDILHFYFNFEQTFAPLLKILHPNVIMLRSFVGYVELSPLKKRLMYPSILSINNYIFISKYIQSRYETLFPVLRNRRTQIIYNAPVNVLEITPNIEQRDLILFVGGLTKSKNVPLLIEVMNLVVNSFHRKDIELTIIGDGEDRPDIEEMIKKYNLLSNIHLLGYSRKVSEYLSRCKIYLHPATNEGFGISVVEAMYMYCPCIVSKASALPELIDESSGFVIDPNDAMEWAKSLIYLNDNLTVRKELAIGANLRAKKCFSMHSFIESHDNLYNQLKTLV